jgi:dTDP-4-dehydrorhamnose reductase
MKVLLIGCNGQLGHSLADTAPSSVEIIGLDLPELDITDAVAVLEICSEIRPDVIINAAAYTAVDQAETEVALATAVNVDGPRNIAKATRSIDSRLIHISTDFVFDGQGSTPYRADTSPNPLSVYGQTKRDGELAVLEAAPNSTVVIRTSWLYSKTGSNFVKTMLRLMSEKDELGIVADQTGTPTWSDSLAKAIWEFARVPALNGIFHWSYLGETTWRGFAVAIQEEALSLGLLKSAIPIRPITTADYPTPAIRPPYSVLDCSKTHSAINMRPQEWRANLREMLKGMTD